MHRVIDFKMLSTVPKSRRRRRRRHKRSVPASNTTDSNNLEVEDNESVKDKIDYNDKNKTFSPRVNSKFINEDVEIETAMLLKHLTKDTEFGLKKERAIDFFTSNLSIEELKKIESTQSKTDEQIGIMPLPEPAAESYQADGPQLASFYLSDELNFENVVVPFDRKTFISFDGHQIFSPALTLPKQLPNDLESSRNEVAFVRNAGDEGHFVKTKPKISHINHALFINRIIEEGALNWFDFNRKEIKNLCDLAASKRLIKTFCAEHFHPIDYPPTSVCVELDAFSFQDRILKVHIMYISFDTHPTFNDEQKLARELESLYEEYVAQKQSNILMKIETKLKILRHLLETVSRSSKTKVQNKHQTADNLQVHRNELKELRATWHRESSKNRELMKEILEKWTELKKLREGVSEPTTSLKLLIKVQESDIDNDEREWSQRFEMEHREMFEEAMHLYQKQKTTHKKDAKNGKKNQGEEANPNVEAILKPISSKIEQELSEIFEKSMRLPGEKIIDFELERNNTAIVKNPPKYIVRMLLDDARAQLEFPESTKLNNIGQAHCNAIYSIKFTMKIPHQIKFQVKIRNRNL